ncbi:ABC transporter [Lishizhenia tianjinensis]|uniref:ABC transporter n=1 Tax=Lishizhenia tianjinensis TaxID=477690 RepID=A0A1I6XSL7_9FLAO|nr:ABC transporter ATP-binding protein [Lishizhenia tianjinensis]SFT41033.1 ABC transporter [Lishizhenia tianjinensis]
MLKVTDLSFNYPDNPDTFTQLNMEVAEGEVAAVVGPSGSGKSTFLQCLGGLLQPKEGKIKINGEKVLGLFEQLIAGHDDIALVNQDFALDDYHTTEENIRNIILNLPKKERDEFVQELLDLLDLNLVAKQQAITLSGGERQRLSLARALAKEPKLLLLDEPFSHLDIHLRRKVGHYIKKLCEIRKMSVILVTHEGEEALSWADTLYFFYKHKMKKRGAPLAVYNAPKDYFEASFFGECNVVVIDKKEYFFRPHAYGLSKDDTYKHQLEISYQYADFRGAYFANFFTCGEEEIVLYAPNNLKELNTCYV